ncbi:Temptin [Phytophthora ramorum]|uniref:Temptin Cys/Cys disulfide domain-containing protein n=1 Tax=Phytophthora ramorum TaxID=164328 RepID=H3H183_PHYRM|nr:Temptin [Phytophthora ramorum]
MKSFVTFSAAAALSMATVADLASAMQAYLDYIPNGSLFSQELGHPDKDSSQYTDFATAFEAVGLSWTAAFCADTFPNSDMTNGAAFGDPCCTWAQGGTPDFTVTAFTTDPATATVCATSASTTSSAASSTTSSADSTTSSASSSTTDTTTTSTTSSSTTDSSTSTSTSTSTTTAPTSAAPTSSATTDTSATTTTAPSTDSNAIGGGCRAKLRA